MIGATGVAGVIGAVCLALIAFIRIFLARQISDLREDVERLEHHLADLEQRYDEQRGLKHKALNDVTRAVMALTLVQRLARECTCGALSPVIEIVDRMMVELATVPPREEPS